MARAVARLTGQENVSCEINNLEYSSIRTSFFEEMESHTDTFTATIKIKGDRKAIDKNFKDFIEGRE
ncbi:chemotaxis protein [Acetobacter orientalis]|uniref:Chemotaxis protein n=1 Tax=Acetobacter orientalis TaxID=146474 RepID=A0A2Z5ZHD8_9PROT|nr:chemotaxis protein [Acetobacter orientalis]